MKLKTLLFTLSFLALSGCNLPDSPPGRKTSTPPGSTTSTPPGHPGYAAASSRKQSPFRWPPGKKAALSLTFDDARLSQADYGLPILEVQGVKATFYVSLSALPDRLDIWKQALAAGHEIGNHSLRHACTGNFPFSRQKALENYTLDQMRTEILQANREIENLLGVRPATFAYPCGQKFVGRGPAVKSYVPLIAEHFLAGRGWFDEGPNDPAFCDFAQLLALELDGKSFIQLKPLLDRTIKQGGWLILVGHNIGLDGPQTTLIPTLKELCAYARDRRNGLWIDTVQTIAQYINTHRPALGKNEKP